MATHEPVLLAEVLTGLAPKPGDIILDATTNRGGHALALCSLVAAHGRLIGLDADGRALAEAGERLKVCPCPVTLIETNFRTLGEALDRVGVAEIDIALFDLGFSSEQLESSGRGFSFQRDEPLQMTFSASPSADALSAEVIVNTWREETLADIIYAFGEERFARRIAAAIVTARVVKPITRTSELVEVIRQAVPHRYQQGRLHFATRTFQALRLVVNDELRALEEGLATAWSRLRPLGRLAVITFHSLEARVVKQFYREQAQSGAGEILTSHAVRPSRAEIIQNPRSRSAQLRILKKSEKKYDYR